MSTRRRFRSRGIVMVGLQWTFVMLGAATTPVDHVVLVLALLERSTNSRASSLVSTHRCTSGLHAASHSVMRRPGLLQPPAERRRCSQCAVLCERGFVHVWRLSRRPALHATLSQACCGCHLVPVETRTVVGVVSQTLSQSLEAPHAWNATSALCDTLAHLYHVRLHSSLQESHPSRSLPRSICRCR